ncbi:MAG: hypothetical protein QM767_27495 [Anaeromyxobacter sp.]
MSRLPRPLARRLDRLARRAHAFHRWAHHPLCDRYAGEVFRAGRRTRLCRGCTLAATGGAAGLALGALLPPAPGALLLAAAVALLVLAPLAVRGRAPGPTGEHAPVRPERSRGDAAAESKGESGKPPKLLIRFLPTLAAGALLGQALRSPRSCPSAPPRWPPRPWRWPRAPTAAARRTAPPAPAARTRRPR